MYQGTITTYTNIIKLAKYFQDRKYLQYAEVGQDAVKISSPILCVLVELYINWRLLLSRHVFLSSMPFTYLYPVYHLHDGINILAERDFEHLDHQEFLQCQPTEYLDAVC